MIAARREHGSFEDLFDLTSRVDLRLVNRRVLESLVAAGALDGLHGHRAQQYQAIGAALDLGQRTQRDRDSGQTSLMDVLDTDASSELRPRRLPEAKPWADGEALAREKEVLGMYISGHPLARYERELSTFATATTVDLVEMEDDEPVRLGGIITNVKTTTDRKGERMAFVTLEDFSGSVELVGVLQHLRQAGARSFDATRPSSSTARSRPERMRSPRSSPPTSSRWLTPTGGSWSE